MNKKLKLLMIFNCISYLIMADIAYLLIYDLFNGLSNILKFIMGNMPLLLITFTSFILAGDRHKEFRCVKKEAVFDWGIRIVAFVISIGGISCFENSNIIFISISVAFFINCIIEYIMYKKISENYKNGSIEKEIDAESEEITLEEKNNLVNLKRAINSSFFSIFIFVGVSLSIANIVNIEGTTIPKIFPEVISFLVFLWFVSKNYENYEVFYLDKKYSKIKFLKDFIFVSIAYIACLIISVVNYTYKVSDYVLFIAMLCMIPMANTVHKKALRLRYIIKELSL